MKNLFWIHSWRQLRKMDKSFDAILNACEGTERCNLCNGACDDLTRCITLLHSRPGVNLCTFDRERDFLFVFVDAKNLDFYFLTDMENFAGMIDAAPGE